MNQYYIMSNIYYGAGPVPKGKVKASMVQAAKARQVRLYGLYKVDPILLKSVHNVVKNKDDKNRMDILKEIFRNKGKQRKIEIQISDNKEEEIKDYKKINKELQKEIDKLAVQNKKLYQVLKTMPKKEDKEEEEEEDTLESKPIDKMDTLELRRILIRLRTRKQTAIKNKKPFSKEDDEKISKASERLKSKTKPEEKFSFEKEHDKITKEMKERELKRSNRDKMKSSLKLNEEYDKITKEIKGRESKRMDRNKIKESIMKIDEMLKQEKKEEPKQEPKRSNVFSTMKTEELKHMRFAIQQFEPEKMNTETYKLLDEEIKDREKQKSRKKIYGNTTYNRQS